MGFVLSDSLRAASFAELAQPERYLQETTGINPVKVSRQKLIHERILQDPLRMVQGYLAHEKTPTPLGLP